MLRAIWLFLVVTFALAGGLSAQAPKTANGKRLFEAKACYQCHGWQGQGGLAGPRLAQTKLSLEAFRSILDRTKNLACRRSSHTLTIS